MNQYDDIDRMTAIPRLFKKVRSRISTEMEIVVRKNNSGAARYIVRWVTSAGLNSYQMQSFLKYILDSASSGKGSLEEAAHIVSHVPSISDLVRAGNAEQKDEGESYGTSRLEEEIRKLNATGTEVRSTLDKMKKRLSATATKSDLRAATKTVLRGEDVNKAKPGPQMNDAKRRQIATAKEYKRTHCGCTLHHACQKSFSSVEGGFKSAESLYSHLNEEMKRS